MDAFNAINGHANGLGHTNDGALCQEFLSGTEFVIDGVSRDGVYKVRSLNWRKVGFIYHHLHLSALTHLSCLFPCLPSVIR